MNSSWHPEWIPCQAEHPEKGIIDARKARHPVAGTIIVYPVDKNMGMWIAYAPEMLGEPQHLIGVFTSDRFDKEISDSLWLEVQKQAEARIQFSLERKHD